MPEYTLTAGIEIQRQVFPNETYRLLPEKIEGFVDELEALKQAIYKVLSTERYEYPIYGFSYGIAWKELIGAEQPFIRAEMKRMIEEALLEDDRILEVDGFDFEFSEDICHCTFEVHSIYGEIEIETEATV